MANKPNNPSLWSKAKSMAKQKFDVYPSAYANGWAAKWYKSKGGTWRSAQEGGMIYKPIYQTSGSFKNRRNLNKDEVRIDGIIYNINHPNYRDVYEEKVAPGNIIWDDNEKSWISVAAVDVTAPRWDKNLSVKQNEEIYQDSQKRKEPGYVANQVRRGTGQFARGIGSTGNFALETMGAPMALGLEYLSGRKDYASALPSLDRTNKHFGLDYDEENLPKNEQLSTSQALGVTNPYIAIPLDIGTGLLTGSVFNRGIDLARNIPKIARNNFIRNSANMLQKQTDNIVSEFAKTPEGLTNYKNNLINRLKNTEEGKKRLATIGLDPEDIDDFELTFNDGDESFFRTRYASPDDTKLPDLNIDYKQLENLKIDPRTAMAHEFGHYLQELGIHKKYKNYLEQKDKAWQKYKQKFYTDPQLKDQTEDQYFQVLNSRYAKLNNLTPNTYTYDDFIETFKDIDSNKYLPKSYNTRREFYEDLAQNSTPFDTKIVDDIEKSYDIEKIKDLENYSSPNFDVFKAEDINQDFNYFKNIKPSGMVGFEPYAHLREFRKDMMNAGILKNEWDEITEDMIDRFMKSDYKSRIKGFSKNDNEFRKNMSNLLNKYPAVVPAAIVTGAGIKQRQGNRMGGRINYQTSGTVKIDNKNYSIKSPEYKKMYDEGVIASVDAEGVPTFYQGSDEAWNEEFERQRKNKVADAVREGTGQFATGVAQGAAAMGLGMGEMMNTPIALATEALSGRGDFRAALPNMERVFSNVGVQGYNYKGNDQKSVGSLVSNNPYIQTAIDLPIDILLTGRYLKAARNLIPKKIVTNAKQTDEFIRNQGLNIIKDLESNEGKKRLINQFKEADPNLADWQLEDLYNKRIAEVKDAVIYNKARFYRQNNISTLGWKDEFKDAAQKELEEEYFPKNNAHWSSENPFFPEKRLTNESTTEEWIKFFKNRFNLGEEAEKITGLKKFMDRNFKPGSIALGKGLSKNRKALAHEIAHAIQKGGEMPIDNELRNLYQNNSFDELFNLTLSPQAKRSRKYFIDAGGRDFKNETYPFLREQREKMIEQGILKNTYDEVTPNKLLKSYMSTLGSRIMNPGESAFQEGTRLLTFTPFWKYKELAKIFNKAPVIVPAAIGTGAGINMLDNQRQGNRMGGRIQAQHGVQFAPIYKQEGGRIKAQTGDILYVSDPNDPRLQSYQDSSNLYKAYQMQDKLMGSGNNPVKSGMKWTTEELKEGRKKRLIRGLEDLGPIAIDYQNEREQFYDNKGNKKPYGFTNRQEDEQLIKYYKSLGFTDDDIMYHSSPDIVSNKIQPIGTYFDGTANSPNYSNVKPKVRVEYRKSVYVPPIDPKEFEITMKDLDNKREKERLQKMVPPLQEEKYVSKEPDYSDYYSRGFSPEDAELANKLRGMSFYRSGMHMDLTEKDKINLYKRGVPGLKPDAIWITKGDDKIFPLMEDRIKMNEDPTYFDQWMHEQRSNKFGPDYLKKYPGRFRKGGNIPCYTCGGQIYRKY